jgi:hypothetical protein
MMHVVMKMLERSGLQERKRSFRISAFFLSLLGIYISLAAASVLDLKVDGMADLSILDI